MLSWIAVEGLKEGVLVCNLLARVKLRRINGDKEKSAEKEIRKHDTFWQSHRWHLLRVGSNALSMRRIWRNKCWT
jgi:hypothetical protein